MKPSKVEIKPSSKKDVAAVKGKAQAATSVPVLRGIVAELCDVVAQLQERL